MRGLGTAWQPPNAWSRPIFRWAGSKRLLVPLLMNCAPASYTRYVEPFAGSACLFFAIRPVKALLGDFNAELMHAYKVMSLHPRLVARALAALPTTSDFYYSVSRQIS